MPGRKRLPKIRIGKKTGGRLLSQLKSEAKKSRRKKKRKTAQSRRS